MITLKNICKYERNEPHFNSFVFDILFPHTLAAY